MLPQTGSPEGKGRLLFKGENTESTAVETQGQTTGARNKTQDAREHREPPLALPGHSAQRARLQPKGLSVPYSPSETNLEEEPSTFPGIFSGSEPFLLRDKEQTDP